MCMEDIRLGRQSLGGIYKGTVNNASPTEACPANPHRTSLYLSPPNTTLGTNVMLSYSPNPQMTVGEGVSVSHFGQGIILTVEDMGDLITKAWFVIANTAGSQTWSILEKSLGLE